MWLNLLLESLNLSHLQPGALLFFSGICSAVLPLKIAGLFTILPHCFSVAFAADHYRSILHVGHFLPIFADSFDLILPFPQGWSVYVDTTFKAPVPKLIYWR